MHVHPTSRRTVPFRSLSRTAALVAFSLAMAACSAANTTPTATAKTPPNAVATPTLHAQIAPTDDDAGGTASEVFERAKHEMELGKIAHARSLFDRVALADAAEQSSGAPPSQLGRAAAYNAALCSERLGDSKDARDRYAKLAAAAPDSPDATDALLRRGRIDVELEDYDDLSLSSSALLAKAGLLPGDRAEALALQAIALVASKDLASAEKDVQSAEKLLDTKDDATPPPPQNAAAVWFARGEVIRAKGALIALNPPPPDFGVKMEARCQAILDAEDAYVESIKTDQVYWAVRAGVRVASLYTALHDDLLEIPAPKSASTDAKKALFKGAMRLRYRILLEKGLGTIEHTLNLEQATGVKTVWFDRAREMKAHLEKELADEKAELAKLPYTEAQLQKALDDLGKSDKSSKG